MTDLTVCVPVYNVESYLEQCVESILGQIYRDIQVILVDDGSTDASGRICDEFAQRDERVKVLHKNNEGPIAARYAGLKLAITEYVTFVDADDWLDIHMYEDLMRLANQTGCEVIASGKITYFSPNNFRSSHDQFKEGLYLSEQVQSDIIPHMIWDKEYGVDPSLAIKIFLRKKVLRHYKMLVKEKFHYGEDMAIVYPLIMESQSIFITHKAYYYHRQRRENEIASYIASDDFFLKLLSLYHYLINVIKKSASYANLRCQLDLWYIESVNLKKKCYPDNENSIKWLFPFGEVRYESEVILYGAGAVGKSFFRQIEKTKYCNIIAWLDRRASEFCGNYWAILSPDYIINKKYDAIVIAIQDMHTREKIFTELVNKYNVKREKIIWKWE